MIDCVYCISLAMFRASIDHGSSQLCGSGGGRHGLLLILRIKHEDDAALDRPAADPGWSGLLDLDLNIDAGWKVQALQRVHRLRRGIQNVEQALVDTHRFRKQQ